MISRPLSSGPEDVYTLANYRYFLFGYPGNPDGYNCLDLAVFGRTLIAAVFVTILDLILCYPIAFYLAQVARGRMTRVLAALIVPYWINEISALSPSHHFWGERHHK